jgi:ammonia channel protein AmtB
MPYREKSAWGSLIATLGVYGVYFAVLIPRLAASPGRSPPYLGLLFACVLALIASQIALQVGIAITMRHDAKLPMDERERLIVLKSDRVALGVLTTLLALGWLGYLIGPDFTATRAVLANALLFTLVAAALAKYTSQIVYFHRGA